MKIKKRLDVLVREKYHHLSRNQIQSFIMQGKVTIDGIVRTKPGEAIPETTTIEVIQNEPQYVCRAGAKLEKALDYFGIDPKGLVVLDAGLSTGGFTDCLLQHGALRVYGVDVGYGQVHEKIRKDPRVVILERTNLRYLTSLPEKVDLVTLDLSFISVTKVMDAVIRLMKDDGKLIVLIKPQFEAKREEVGRGGIIKDPALHQRIVADVTRAIEQKGFKLQGVTESPIEGTSGNKEFLAFFIRAIPVRSLPHPP